LKERCKPGNTGMKTEHQQMRPEDKKRNPVAKIRQIGVEKHHATYRIWDLFANV
jgi:hypothetical protein